MCASGVYALADTPWGSNRSYIEKYLRRDTLWEFKRYLAYFVTEILITIHISYRKGLPSFIFSKINYGIYSCVYLNIRLLSTIRQSGPPPKKKWTPPPKNGPPPQIKWVFSTFQTILRGGGFFFSVKKIFGLRKFFEKIFSKEKKKFRGNLTSSRGWQFARYEKLRLASGRSAPAWLT